ncbi:hypothetical protein [Paraglaciecola sp.]|uniref:hypothetical protein n=1 Tax=Paraglaciecola sp. TaxID=1920173 RepID=UPI003263F51D
MDKSDRLKSTIEKGAVRFILIHGVIGWGISTAILFKFIMQFKDDKPFFDGIIEALIMFPIGGIFFGAIMWVIMRSQYKKLQSS